MMRQSAAKAGCAYTQPARGRYFLFTGKLSYRLTISRFGCIHYI